MRYLLWDHPRALAIALSFIALDVLLLTAVIVVPLFDMAISAWPSAPLPLAELPLRAAVSRWRGRELLPSTRPWDPRMHDRGLVDRILERARTARNGGLRHVRGSQHRPEQPGRASTAGDPVFRRTTQALARMSAWCVAVGLCGPLAFPNRRSCTTLGVGYLRVQVGEHRPDAIAWARLSTTRDTEPHERRVHAEASLMYRNGAVGACGVVFGPYSQVRGRGPARAKR